MSKLAALDLTLLAIRYRHVTAIQVSPKRKFNFEKQAREVELAKAKGSLAEELSGVNMTNISGQYVATGATILPRRHHPLYPFQ